MFPMRIISNYEAPVVTDPLPSIRLLSDGGRIPGPTETAVLFHESGGGESGGGREEIR